MLNKDQNLLEKYYFYEGNTTQREDLQKYLQTEVYANGIARKTTVLLENRSAFCSVQNTLGLKKDDLMREDAVPKYAKILQLLLPSGFTFEGLSSVFLV